MTRVREWKPGDVALIEVGCAANRHIGLYVTDGWRYGADRWVANDPAIVTARPLVVIDPEDREQVERLVREMRLPVEVAAPADRLQAALREFAAAVVRPEEPTAVGALVTDRDGEMWVRHVRGEWACLHSAPGKDVRTWVELVAQYSPLKIEEPA